MVLVAFKLCLRKPYVFIRKPYVHLGDTIVILIDEYFIIILLHNSIIFN